MDLERHLAKMREDWDQRARDNDRHFIATLKQDWADEDFFASGEQTVAEQIATDLENVCQGKAPGEMRVLEIGCGSGRITRALAKRFGEVHAVDVSGEMIARAREALHDTPNAFVYQNNGMDLQVVPALGFDFAFSIYVFQHIPSYEVIENYIREVGRLLRPGALFKFQAQGYTGVNTAAADTWVGVPISEARAAQLAESCGFEARYSVGAETEEFWLWFFKR